VAAVFPEKLLGGYIYTVYAAPPVRTRPHPNLVLVQATNSAYEQGRDWEHERDWEQKWGALATRIFKYDIDYSGETALNLIAPVTTHLCEKLRAEHQAGFSGGTFYMGQTYEQLGAGHFLLAKLMWDPEADAAAWEQRFYAALYGPAADDVQAYYALLESRLRKVFLQGIDVQEPAVHAALGHRSELGSPAHTLAAYWPILGEADQTLKQAQARELGTAEKHRLHRLIAQHELLVSTVGSVILAGRLEVQGEFNPSDVAGWSAALERRERIAARLKTEAPNLAPLHVLENPNRGGLAALSSRSAAFSLLQTASPTISALRTNEPPRLDGQGSDRVWKQTAFRPLLENATGSYPTQGARAAVAFDAQNLYVLLEGNRGGKSRPERADDRVELMLSPPGGTSVYHVVLDSGGNLSSTLMPLGAGGGSARAWRSDAQGRFASTGSSWSAELAVPFASLTAPSAKGAWRLNLVHRARDAGGRDEIWASSPNFDEPLDASRFAVLQFGVPGTASYFQFGSLEDLLPAEAAKRLRFNPTGGARLAIVSPVAYAGVQSVLIQVPESGTGGITFTADVQPQTLYRARLAYRTRNTGPDGGVVARIIFRDEHHRPVTEPRDYIRKNLAPVAEPDEWSVPLMTFATPARATEISLTLACNAPGEFGFDEIALEKIGPLGAAER
jgi:hypothetical protein